MFHLHRKAKRQTDILISIRQFEATYSLRKIYKEIDLIGFFLLIASLIMILLPLNIAGTLGNGWKTPSMILLILLGAVLLIILILWEYKYANKSSIPLKLLKNRTALGAILILVCVGIDSSLNWQCFLLYFMITRKLDPTRVTLLFKGYQMGYLVSGFFVAFSIKKKLNLKYFLIAGAALNCIGIGTMIPSRLPHSTEFSIHVTQTIAGVGQTILDIGIVVAYQGSVSRKNVATITGTAQILRGIFSAFGNTVAGTVWNQVIPELIKKYVEGNIDITKAMNEMTYIWGLPENRSEQVVTAFGDGQMTISAISCGLAEIGFLITVFMIKSIDIHNTQKFDEYK
ncbi:hypothetical protein K502DRAFT_344935 [Neoconidiobolus thromboides FSU 785]|nr:hypothetical protein K502DRAFT_344935 [Neoconidiobolus thromboides FSU 785]